AGAGSNPDDTWDTVWDSKGKLTRQGYIVWEAIPFKSLRFHGSAEQTWGIVLFRYIARNNESDYWPRVSSRINGTLNQEGTISGVEGVSPSHNMQFNPYTTARGFRALDLRDPVQPRLFNKTFQGRVGLDSKFVFHDSLVLDTTINPDFSQVESDEPQNTVNQRFEKFFPEKRPFFLENANFFEPGLTSVATNDLLLFTRRIADPEFGARLTGKQGPWNLGLLATDDRSPGRLVPVTSLFMGKRAYFAIGRVTHDIGKQSSVGAVYTDREFAGYYNRVGGLDTSLRLAKNWTATARSVVSSTLDQDRGYRFGADTNFVVDGEGRRFSNIFQYQDITANFRTATGFVPRTDVRHVFNYFHFYWRPERKVVLWGPELTSERIWDHNGTGLLYVVNADIAVMFRPNIVIAPIGGVQSDTLRPVDFPGLSFDRKFVEDFAGFVFKGNLSRQVTVNTTVIRGGTPVVVVPSGQLPVEGDETTVNETLTLRPFGALQIDNTYILDRVVHNPLHRSAFNNHIFRSKWNYQFTRALSLRVIAQYNNLLVNPQFSSLQTTRNVNLDFLITYLVHPGTALYIGYNSNLQNVAPELCARLPGTEQCDPNGAGLLRGPAFINDGRQFFVKVAYLFRR
ncbi:MAG TPA: DUF5916 domain-containing protein, partial [Terriglobales bacterium]|nr:DUF5916 domain-containing protein [Terriglobales bacterium]